jgi:hypothetical protein
LLWKDSKLTGDGVRRCCEDSQDQLQSSIK